MSLPFLYSFHKYSLMPCRRQALCIKHRMKQICLLPMGLTVATGPASAAEMSTELSEYTLCISLPEANLQLQEFAESLAVQANVSEN